MGVWITPHVMPAEDRRLSHDDFTTMILRVLHEGYGHGPITVASGLISQPFARDGRMITYLGHVDVPTNIAVFPHDIPVERYDAVTGEPTGAYGVVTIWHHGDDREALAGALSSLPYGREEIWIEFAGWDGPEFHVLPEARAIGFWNAWCPEQETYATAAHVCRLAGEKGRKASVCDFPISAILEDYYGSDLRMAYTYS